MGKTLQKQNKLNGLKTNTNNLSENNQKRIVHKISTKTLKHNVCIVYIHI